MEFSPNLQKLRHGLAAQVLRRLVYAWIVGDDDWPPKFVAADRRTARHIPSENVYVHLPFCETICPHCPYNTARFETALSRDYALALLREIDDYVQRSDAVPIRSLYFGGGSPSLTPRTVAAVIEAFRPLLIESAEIAIEVYPTHASPAALERFRSMGVNRLSLGIETLERSLLRKLGRRYSPDRARESVATAMAAGFELVDVNLIFGIPGQDCDRFLAGVGELLEMGVGQISAYPLFTFDHTPAGQPQRERRYARAGAGRRLAMQQGVSRVCRQAGLERTSVWSFTRQGRTAYTTVTRPDYVGFGAGAGSKSAERAAFNTFSVRAYTAAAPRAIALIHELSPRQRRADWLYWQIYNAHIDAAAYVERFGHAIEQDFGRLLRILCAFGYLRREASGYELTESGAIRVHRMQSVFSLNGIDAVWSACQRTSWPEEIRVA